MTNDPQRAGTAGKKPDAVWYYSRGDERVGPISSRDLTALAQAGDITPETLIWREGLKEWVEANVVKGLFPDGKRDAPTPIGELSRGARESREDPPFHRTQRRPLTDHRDATTITTPVTRVIDQLLGRMRFFEDDPQAFMRKYRMIAKQGTWLVLVAGALLFVGFVVTAIKFDVMVMLWSCWAAILGAFALHYMSARFANVGPQLIGVARYTLPSNSVLDCAGLLLLLVGLAALPIAVYVALKTGAEAALPVFALAVISTYLAVLCLNPKTCLNVHIDATRQGVRESAVSMFIVICRVMLACGPLSLFAWSAYATVMGVGSVYYAFNEMGAELWVSLREGCTAAIWGALTPLVLYLLYLFCVLIADVIRAVFDIAHNTQHERARS